MFFCVPLGHQIIVSRPHASDYDLPVISSLKSGAVGSGVIAVFLLLLGFVRATASVTDERRTSGTPTFEPILRLFKLPRAFVAITILAATVGVACLSGVVGVLIMNHVGEPSLTPRHSACAAAVGFCVYICFLLLGIGRLADFVIFALMFIGMYLIFWPLGGLWYSIKYVKESLEELAAPWMHICCCYQDE